MKRLCFKVLLIAIVLSLPLIPGMTFNVYAGAPEPLPPGWIITGPEIVGTLTLIHSGDPYDYSVKAIFYGFCRGLPYPLKKKFCYWPIFVPFNEICHQDKNGVYIKLKKYKVFEAGPEDCLSECGGETLIITKVNKCERRTATKIVAEVVFKYLILAGE